MTAVFPFFSACAFSCVCLRFFLRVVSLSAQVEVVLQIYLNRMDADSSAGGTSTKGRHYGSEKSTAELTRMYFEDTYGGAGSKKMAKNFKAFVLALNEVTPSYRA